MDETLRCEAIADEGQIERYLAGTLSEADVEAWESHYLTCARCQSEVRLGAAIRSMLPEVREALSDDGEESVAARPRFGGRAKIGAIAGAVAAVLAGILLVKPAPVESPQHREVISETEIVPSVESPIGDVAAIVEFRWAPVTGAELYDITLFNETGDVLWQVESRETRAALPDSVRLDTGALYLWQVNARVGWDRWVSSEMVRFRVTEP